MILNVSRIKSFKMCPRKAFNTYHRHVEGLRSMNLVDGGAVHAGIAKLRACKDMEKATEAAKEEFDEMIKTSTIPEEQLYLVAEHWELVQSILEVFKNQYDVDQYQIIQPECEFVVDLPESHHNCVMIHWVDSFDGSQHWGPPPAEMILGHRVLSPHGGFQQTDCHCYQPHRIKGKTDAIVAWNNNIWLDEYKTTSISGDQFWDQWWMDVQPTTYIYGIWKTLKIRPRGFFLHALKKPSEAQVSGYNSKRKNHAEDKKVKDYLAYEREAFLRTEEDLARCERYLFEACLDWEEQVTSGTDRMLRRTPFQYNPSSHTCYSYNRKCDYMSACKSHDEPGEFSSLCQKAPDYIDEELDKLIKIKEVA